MSSLYPKSRLNKPALYTKLMLSLGKKSVTKQGVKSVCIYLTYVATALVVAGCGQKGNLYLPKDANPNTEFIIYKSNKPEAKQVEKSDRPLQSPDDANPHYSDNPFLGDLDNPNNY